MAAKAVMRNVLWLAASAAALGFVRGLSAASACDEARGRELFAQGRAVEDSSDMAAACERYAASMAACERASTAVKLGYCRRREGSYVAAWQVFQHARELNNRVPSAYRPDLEREIQEALRQIPTARIEVETQPDGLSVELDGKPLPASEVGRFFPVEPGEHVVVATAPGHRTVTSKFVGQEQQLVVIRLALVPEAAGVLASGSEPPRTTPAALPAPSPSRVQPAPPLGGGDGDGSGQRTAGMIATGAGVVGLGAAGVLGILTLQRVRESDKHCPYPDGSCDPRGVELRNEASELQTAGFIVGGASLAVASAGLLLWLMAPEAGSERRPTGGFAGLSCSPVGLALSGRVTW